MIKNFLLVGLIILILLLSGCISFYNNDNNPLNTNYISVNKMRINYKDILQKCDDNDVCTIEYLDENLNCQYWYDYKCLESRDNNKLKQRFDEKTKSCHTSLEIQALVNSCYRKDINEKRKCVSQLAEKANNINCCYLVLPTYEAIKKEEYKRALKKCEIDFIINSQNPKSCFDTLNPKECFVCYLRNNHLNPYTSNICAQFNEDQKRLCNSSILLDYRYCDKISDEQMKKECLSTTVNLNNCTYYNLPLLPTEVSGKQKTNAQEVYNNTKTRLDFVKRKEANIDELVKNYKYSESYKFAFDDTIDLERKLDKCTLNTKTPNLDFNKKRYSTFYFDYKDFHFIYAVPVFDDLYIYSKNLKDQHCYEFDANESYKRYLKDELNNAVLKRIAEDFNSLVKHGFNENEIFEIVVRFVQQIPYNYQWEKRNVYPYEVLYLMRGVCLDKVIILAQILRYLGYETYIASGIVKYTESPLPHAILAVPCNNSDYVYENKRMCLIETTHPFLINEMEINNKLKFTKISSGKQYTEEAYGPNKAKELKKYENKLNELSTQITDLYNKKRWQEYNNLVKEYNNYLYKMMKIRFKNYQ